MLAVLSEEDGAVVRTFHQIRHALARACTASFRLGIATLVTVSLAVTVASSVYADNVRFAGPSPGGLRGATVSKDGQGRVVVYGGGARAWNPESRTWEELRTSGLVRQYLHTATEI